MGNPNAMKPPILYREFPKIRGYCTLGSFKGYYKGTIRIPLKGSIRVQSFRKLGGTCILGALIIRILLFRGSL